MNTAPDPEKKKPYEPFGWRFWIFLVALVSLLYGFGKPRVIDGCGKSAVVVEATSNARQIGLALFEFDREYGAYPSEATATLVTKKRPDHGYDLSGKSSNALFRQLFAAEIIQSEAIFHAKADGIEMPDGDFSAGNALAPGEVAFGYVAGLSTEGNPGRVLAFCPIIPGTDRFDPKPFDGKAVVLRMDNSVTSLSINEDGYAMLGGKTLFETGGDTAWARMSRISVIRKSPPNPNLPFSENSLLNDRW